MFDDEAPRARRLCASTMAQRNPPCGVGAVKPGVTPVQPESELDARKAKKNQGKTLGFPWISLAESGLFNGLRGIQIKKS
jgi:hypothetical protein